MNTSLFRVLLFFAVFVMVVVLPWWISSVVIVLLTIYLKLYLESIFLGFLYDVLYSAQFAYTGLFLSTAFLILVSFVRTRIRT